MDRFQLILFDNNIEGWGATFSCLSTKNQQRKVNLDYSAIGSNMDYAITYSLHSSDKQNVINVSYKKYIFFKWITSNDKLTCLSL